MKNETPRDRAFGERLAKLERQIESLMGSNPSRRLSATDESGNEILYAGILPNALTGGTDIPGLVVRRQDGSVAMLVGGWTVNGQYFALKDRDGNVIVSDDAVSGAGLARPYIPLHFYNGDTTTWPGTSAGTLTGLWFCRANKQNARVTVEVGFITTTADTAGQIQLWDATAGAQVGPLITVPTNSNTGITWNTIERAEVASTAFGVDLNIEVRARRTAGTGIVRVMPTYATGDQSP